MKPPKNLVPEDDDAKPPSSSRGFGEDSFRNYMTRKIELQRKQFGLAIPPDPREINTEEEDRPSKRKSSELRSDVNTVEGGKKKKKSGMATVLKRLKRKHGKDPSRRRSKRKKKQNQSNASREEMQERQQLGESVVCEDDAEEETSRRQEDNTEQRSAKLIEINLRKRRQDLFFGGVVVLVNGYTDPDAGTIQRMLHRHGGDLEKYETGRVTHIIAEHLSTAKANIYKRQRRPTPVCRPQWIVDSVETCRLLPHADYLLDEVRDENVGTKTVKSFFTTPDKKSHSGTSESDVKIAEVERVLSPEPKRDGCLSQDVSKSEEGRPRNRTESSCEAVAVETPTKSVLQEDNQKASGESTRVEFDTIDPATGKEDETLSKRSVQPQAPTGNFAGKARTVGNDPNFLDSFFSSSRLSFIGSFKQRTKPSPVKKASKAIGKSDSTSRFVFHVDMDCFFANVVLRKFPQHRDKPVAISHHGKTAGTSGSKQSTSECATCNYEARKYGIKKGMFLGQARELCPDLIVLQYDFEGYEEVSEQVTDILYRHSEAHNGAVEQVSCDEAYVEMFLSVDAEGTSRDALAGDIAETIRKEILSTTQCTASVGVGPNKLLAKLATDRIKPNGSFVVRDFRELLEPLKLRDLHGIGYRMDRKLQCEGLVAVRDVWELGDEAEGVLSRVLGPGLGKKILLFCKGEDNRLVQPAERKTIGAECNYGVRFNGPYGVDYMISGLAKEVEKRMEGVGVRGGRITLKMKQRKEGAKPPPKFLGHGSCHNLSKSSDTAVTRDWKVFARIGMKLFEELGVPKDDVRGMGIVVSKLIHETQREHDGCPTGNISAFFRGNQEGTGGKDKIQSTTINSDVSMLDTVLAKNPERDGIETPPTRTNSVTFATATQCRQYEDGKSVDSVRAIARQEGSAEDSEKTTSILPRPAEQSLIDIPTLSQVDEKVLNELPSEIREEIMREAGAIVETGTAQIPGSPGKFEGRDSSPVPDARHQDLMTEDETPLTETLLEVEQVDSQRDDDIALPPLSQIHMSQVMALPRQLRDQLITKMRTSPQDGGNRVKQWSEHPDSAETTVETPKKPRKSPDSKKRSGRHVFDDDNSRLRQVSVKRMLKLAAVKTGEENLRGSLGDSVSLTQLECLPLEMQLQVANNDDIRVGSVSTNRRSGTGRLSTQIEVADTEPAEEAMTANETTPQAPENASAEAVTNEESCSVPATPRSFYQENIRPLQNYMDDHLDANSDDMDRVRDFLCLCIAEHRVDEAAKLLRSIRNRSDKWSSYAYNGLLKAVEEKARDVLGGSLDSKWLGLK